LFIYSYYIRLFEICGVKEIILAELEIIVEDSGEIEIKL